ncbi:MULTISPECIES: L-histidine N(alpha)-methyltransferase [unclassified Rhodococcus (in: high G+C Gram-positive bacteria)]|uniref:L-histidine N(alpha)-methyltransferase n=1 Tax=unclassified Rhodococcus (in: high G+C Gram-positive bacteria) TaxID=192944 RepID=UPI000B9A6C1A|nr:MULTISPECIES: L-histidine N(alpha)-methyltransferase [unclassified Rhodococcus (in: high G+C Gram-positive bacteria)]KAA0927888.1 L-histidine N(alpha)-methyltransferase [Rhodococcus sp. ANT_H53B]MDI9925641.1 L-histidine N(alpha)-methyltransferase [Rhodococcus sp. IEGM 1341]MDV7988619.1 L-histidine N(alpha)-methyltransferase [Rhodococcus sp. IEGM 1374]OZE37471.1 L-histidine N(alpha)-methyltransferase [Rhodococcus sp. 05-2254-4]OZE40604.1 L-histidine N(alpha)-methyltransferase [Rhodococcus sp
MSTVDVHLADTALLDELRKDVRDGLTADPKWLSPKYFYDALGSELFEQITVLPEYYPTRTERALLEEHALDVAEATGSTMLIELGSGSSEKTKILLSAGVKHGSLETYVPQDVSVTALEGAIEQISHEFPALEVRGIVSDFTDTLHNLPSGQARTIAFLGGTLGNLIPEERREFLGAIADALDPGEYLLLGVGLVIDPKVLVPAYDDAAGVTAKFNRNVLSVINSRLGGNFDPDAFEHVALWNAEQEWIEMRLRANAPQEVYLADLDLQVHFDAGEDLRTEISAKFRPEGITEELAAAGFGVDHLWSDADSRFALILARKDG